MKKYAVVVKAISEEPWTEYVADTESEAWGRRKFIEDHLRGVRVEIQEFEEE